MRDYINFDKYLTELIGDVYASPSDPQHSEWRQWIFTNWISKLFGVTTCLDIGCGDGFCKPMAEDVGLKWSGVTIGSEYLDLKNNGFDVYNADMTFLPFHNNSFDLLMAFHVLEHSPFPLITLMEWHRVAKTYLCIVLPTPEFWTYAGRNHYSVMEKEHFRWIAKRAGWRLIWEDSIKQEYRFMLAKDEPQKE